MLDRPTARRDSTCMYLSPLTPSTFSYTQCRSFKLGEFSFETAPSGQTIMVSLDWSRPWSAIVVSALIAVGALIPTGYAESAIQLVWIDETKPRWYAQDTSAIEFEPSPRLPLNPIDVLTSSHQHKIFVRLLQRARLFPVLIRLIQYGDNRGVTLLAPTDDAIQRDESYLWTTYLKLTCSTSESHNDGSTEQLDNVEEQLRQHLLYHIVNYTLPYETVSNISSSDESKAVAKKAVRALPLAMPHMHTSLHHPSRQFLEKPTRPGPISQPPEGSRHPGAEDQGGLLGEGQKFRVLWKWQFAGGHTPNSGALRLENFGPRRGSLWFGVDSNGDGGCSSLEEHWTQRGLVVFLNGILELPPTLLDVVRSHPALSTISSLVDDSFLHSLSHIAHSTFFLPSSGSFDKLTPLQRSYLLRNINSTSPREDSLKTLIWDRIKLLGWHISGRGLRDEIGQWGVVAYSERICASLRNSEQLELTTILGGPLHFRLADSRPPGDESSPATHSVSDDDEGAGCPHSILLGNHFDAGILEHDILTENGVIHLVDSLLLPSSNSLELNVENTLIAINASRFVKMMRKAGLERYLLVGGIEEDDDSAQDVAYSMIKQFPQKPETWTIVAPTDEVLEGWLESNPALGKWWRHLEHFDDDTLRPAPTPSDWSSTVVGATVGQEEDDPLVKLSQLLKYHVFPELLCPKHIRDGELIPTELRDWRLKEGRQRVVATVAERPAEHIVSSDGSEIMFGDANVLAQPIVVNRSSGVNGSEVVPVAIIYPISQLLSPPDDPVQTAVSASLDLSTFVAAIFSGQLDTSVRRAPGVTYLVPNNLAFSNLGGMIMRYLLLNTEESRNSLRQLVGYHFIDEIVYADCFVTNETSFPTLEGSLIWAGKDGESNNAIIVRRQGGVDENGNAFAETLPSTPAHILARNLLTSTGVIHEIDKVEFPPSLRLSNSMLLRGAKCDTFRDLVIRAGYGFVLNGSVSRSDGATASFSQNDEDAAATASVADDNVISSRPSLRAALRQNKRQPKHKLRHRLLEDPHQAYILLAPTDEAFTRLNLTRYLANHDELKKLVELHIIPSPSADDVDNWSRSEEQRHISDDGQTTSKTHMALPLGLLDGWSLPSLLDHALGGVSRFGRVAFREVLASGEDDEKGFVHEPNGQVGHAGGSRPLGWRIGILGTRGGSSSADAESDRHSARILDFGREYRQVRFNKGRGSQTAALGGVLILSAVLQPYEPTWFHRWGWVVITSIFALVAVAGIGWLVWISWVGKRKTSRRGGEDGMGEAMEGEEE